MGLISKLFKLAIFVIILGAMVGVGFMMFASPERLKPKITHALQTYTGLPLQINGPIEVLLRPVTVIKMQDVVLPKSNDDKTPAVQIKDATITVDLMTVLKNNPNVISLNINYPVVNWSLTKELLNTSVQTAQPVTIQQLQVNNGSFTLQGPDGQTTWSLNNLSFGASNFTLNAGQELPALTLQGELHNALNSSKYNIDATAKFDPTNHALTLDPLKMIWNETPVQGSAVIAQYDGDASVSGNFSLAAIDVGTLLKKLDPYFANSHAPLTHTMQMDTTYAYTPKDKILDLTKLNLQLDKGNMRGDIKLGLVSPYRAEFNLTAENLDLGPLGLLSSALFPSVHTMTSLPVDFIKQIEVKGKFSGTQLTYNNALMVDQMQMDINGTGGVVQIMPLLVNAYGGTHDLELQMDVTKDQPLFKITERADKVNLEAWLKAINDDKLLSGTASLKASLEASGNSFASIKQSMNGSISLFVSEGALYGIDITRLMHFTNQTVTDIFQDISNSPAANLNVLAIKKTSNWIQTQIDNPRTDFANFELTVEIEKGISKRADLSLSNNAIDLKGAGSFILRDETLNFNTNITNRVEPTADVKVLTAYMKQTPLNMIITGTLDKINYAPNVQAYVTSILKSSQTDLQNQAITKMLSVTPPNSQTDKTATELFLNSLQSLKS